MFSNFLQQGLLERLAAGPVIGDGGFIFALEKRGFVKVFLCPFVLALEKHRFVKVFSFFVLLSLLLRRADLCQDISLLFCLCSWEARICFTPNSRFSRAKTKMLYRSKTENLPHKDFCFCKKLQDFRSHSYAPPSRLDLGLLRQQWNTLRRSVVFITTPYFLSLPVFKPPMLKLTLPI